MAKTETLHGDPGGRLGPLLYYKRKGSDKIYIRTRPSMSLYARKHHPRFEKTRQQSAEFKGCVKAAQMIAQAAYPVKGLADFNYFGDLVKVSKCIQQTDLERSPGSRAILFSRAHQILDGFSFTRQVSFESLVSSPIRVLTDRVRGAAHTVFPPLVHGINIMNPTSQPFYRFVISLGWVADLQLAENGKDYETVNQQYASYKVAYSSWYDWKSGSFPGSELDIELNHWNDLPCLTLVTAIGIEFGKPSIVGQIEYVKYSGAGKICCTF